LPPLDGGWGDDHPLWASDVLRWFREWESKLDIEFGMPELQEFLQQRIRTLSEREKKVLQLRFGLIDGHVCTPDEVGRELGVTPDEVIEIESRALSKLRPLP
jgi:DNA-directed RNA polymerase sigma subunit (sigma70/sigma32)